jgi:hypothetical protein
MPKKMRELRFLAAPEKIEEELTPMCAISKADPSSLTA